MSDMKIVLPGGAGLVGQNLIYLLQQRGYRNIVVLDKHTDNLAVLRAVYPDVQAYHADLAVAGPWEEHFRGAAAVVMLQAQIGDLEREPFVRNNITATENILAAIKKFSVGYLVHISSSVVNSVAHDLYTETKKDQEKIVVNSGIPCVVLRPTLMFGWFDRKHLGWLSRFMRRTPVFPIPGDGRYMRQPLFVMDFCSIIISCIEKRIVGQSYNITGLEKIDYIDIIRAIKSCLGAKTPIIKIPYGLFYLLLKVWSMFDKNPPFTTDQLSALVAHDEFEVIDWPKIFGVESTPFTKALDMTFKHPHFGNIVLKF